jgi:NTE family protein
MGKIKLGIALSGGGARGLAYVGALKVLERENIRPSFISGTSMGSIMGAAYATGISASELESFTLEATRPRNMMRMVHLAQPSKGLIDVEKLRILLANMIPESMEFSQLKIPLSVCATDLLTGKAVTLREGKVLPAVLASSAFPGVFRAVEVGSLRLVDGGLLNNLPINLAYQLGAEKVIAFDVQTKTQNSTPWRESKDKTPWSFSKPDNFTELMSSVVIMSDRINEIKMQSYPSDLYILLPVDKEITSFSGFTRAEEIIQVGEETTELYLPKIKSLLGLTND